MNLAYCSACGKLAPAAPVERDGQIFLVKKCPACGPTESLISGDAVRIDFQLDKTIAPGASDLRELGIVVESAGLVAK